HVCVAGRADVPLLGLAPLRSQVRRARRRVRLSDGFLPRPLPALRAGDVPPQLTATYPGLSRYVARARRPSISIGGKAPTAPPRRTITPAAARSIDRRPSGGFHRSGP